MRIAVAKGIPIMEVAKTELDRMTEGGVHQGLVLTVPEYDVRRHAVDLADRRRSLVALDGVTDPRNLGAIARSAAAFGADGIIVPDAALRRASRRRPGRPPRARSRACRSPRSRT